MRQWRASEAIGDEATRAVFETNRRRSRAARAPHSPARTQRLAIAARGLAQAPSFAPRARGDHRARARACEICDDARRMRASKNPQLARADGRRAVRMQMSASLATPRIVSLIVRPFSRASRLHAAHRGASSKRTTTVGRTKGFASRGANVWMRAQSTKSASRPKNVGQRANRSTSFGASTPSPLACAHKYVNTPQNKRRNDWRRRSLRR